MTFIFNVFRPYHIITSYNIIKTIKKQYPNAKCIGYISNSTEEFWDDLFDYDKIFDERYYSLNLFLNKKILNLPKIIHNNKIIKSNINRLYFNNPKIDGIITFVDAQKIYQQIAMKYKNATQNNIVMDEGVALYYKNDITESAILKIARKFIYGRGFEVCSTGEHTKTKKIYANYPQKVKSKCAKIYPMPKLNYTGILDVIKIKPEMVNSNKKKCLYISTPTNILNNDDKVNSINCTMKLFETLSKNNIEIYFKMHPANETIEDIRIYLDAFSDIKVIEDQSVPVELLCSANNFEYIISPISSALLNLSSLNFNCISLPYFASKFLQYKDILQLFKANKIKVAQNQEEMVSIIETNEIIMENQEAEKLEQQLIVDNSEFLNSLMEREY
jgi:hypothetical protein